MIEVVEGDGGTAIDANNLCIECGLCCNGTLFDYVRVYPDEKEQVKSAGISTYETNNGKAYFDLGCACFKKGSCSVYLKRPKKCRSYYCKLQKDVMSGTVNLSQALTMVSTVKDYAQWVFKNIPPDSQANKTHHSYRSLIRGFQKKTTAHIENGNLTSVDEARLKRIFEQVKFIHKHFEETSLLRKYADLIVKMRG